MGYKTDFANMGLYGNQMSFPTSSFFNSANMGLPTNSVSVGMESPGIMSSMWDGFTNSDIWKSPFQQTLKDGTKVGGWGTAGLSIAAGLGNAWMGMQQLDLAKDTLAFNKDTFEKNYAAQLGMTRGAVTGKANEMYAANPARYGSDKDAYIAKQLASYGVA